MPEPTNGTPGAGTPSGAPDNNSTITPINVTGSGQAGGQSGSQQPGGEQATRVFTQAEMEHELGERLKRERSKYEDYGTLKEKAGQWDKHLESQKTEQEKQAAALAKAQQERDAATTKSQGRLIRAAFIAEAAKQGVAHPEDVYVLADVSKITLTDSDDVVGVAEAVTAVVKAGRVPMAGNRAAPNIDAGAGNHDKAAPLPGLSDEEIAIARKMGIKPEQYAAQKQRIQGNSGR